MVKKLSKADHEAIEQAVAECESKTGAELVVVIASASDAYQSHILLYGLGLGSMVDCLLWLAGITTDFPIMFFIQIAGMALLSSVPFLRSTCLRLVPKRARYHRAARRAHEELLIILQRVPAATPLVLFYISQAERYAHILPCRIVHEKIPNKEWDKVIAGFTSAMKQQGLRAACLQAIGHCTELLAPAFPPTGKPANHAPNLMELR